MDRRDRGQLQAARRRARLAGQATTALAIATILAEGAGARPPLLPGEQLGTARVTKVS